jgi:hypothetical protein
MFSRGKQVTGIRTSRRAIRKDQCQNQRKVVKNASLSRFVNVSLKNEECTKSQSSYHEGEQIGISGRDGMKAVIESSKCSKNQ